MLVLLWVMVPLAVICGGSLLLSMAVIPSLISTGELPLHTGRLRPLLFAAALISGAALAAALVAAVLASGVIGDFWPRWLL